MVQVGRIHKRIDRCVPGGDRILPGIGPGCPTGYCQKADRRCPTGYCRKADRGVRQDIARKRTGVSDRGSARKKFSFWPKPSPARTQNRLCILKPPCLKVNENLPARARFLFRLFSAKREPFLQKIPFSVLAEGHFDKKENLLLAQDHTGAGPHWRRKAADIFYGTGEIHT